MVSRLPLDDIQKNKYIDYDPFPFILFNMVHGDNHNRSSSSFLLFLCYGGSASNGSNLRQNTSLRTLLNILTDISVIIVAISNLFDDIGTKISILFTLIALYDDAIK